MAFDFPTTPADGSEFTPPGGPTYIFQSPVWMLKKTAVDLIFDVGLLRTGDTVDLERATPTIIGGIGEKIPDGITYGRFNDGVGSWQPSVLTQMKTSIFTSSITFIPDPKTKFMYIDVWGSGGAGGGSEATDATKCSAGAGGGAGGNMLGSFGITDLPPGGVVITIGAAGVGVVGAPGGNGGVTRFDTVTSFLSTTGGEGGTIDTQTVPDVGFNSQAGGAFYGTAGALAAVTGGCGRGGFISPAINTAVGGSGGDSYIGGGALGLKTQTAIDGTNSASPSGGGSGAATAKSGAAMKGGNGGPSVIMVREFG